jgi:hypothetical protein
MTPDTDPHPTWLRRLGLEVPRPSRQTVVGFVAAWICVLAIVMFTVWLRGLGT